MATFLQYVSSGLAMGMIYAVIALGFVLIYKSSGVLNIAQGAFVMLGGYIVYTFSEMMGLPLWLGLLLALGVGFVLALVIERLLLRPLIGQPVMSTIMVTVALMVILEALVVPIWTAFPQALTKVPSGVVSFGPVTLGVHFVYGFIVCLAIFGLFWLFYRRSKLGLGMRATADDETAAHSVGIGSSRIYGLSWAIAIMAAAVGGVFIAWIANVSHLLSYVGLKALPIAIIGGLDSIGGVLIAGLIVGIAETLCIGYLDAVVGVATKEVVPYILMLILLIVKPYGLFGLVRIERI